MRDRARGYAHRVDIVADAFQAVFEALVAFTEALAEFGKLLATEQDQDDYGDDDEMCWCK